MGKRRVHSSSSEPGLLWRQVAVAAIRAGRLAVSPRARCRRRPRSLLGTHLLGASLLPRGLHGQRVDHGLRLRLVCTTWWRIPLMDRSLDVLDGAAHSAAWPPEDVHSAWTAYLDPHCAFRGVRQHSHGTGVTFNRWPLIGAIRLCFFESHCW